MAKAADWTDYGEDHPCHGCEAVGNPDYCVARQEARGPSSCYRRPEEDYEARESIPEDRHDPSR